MGTADSKKYRDWGNGQQKTYLSILIKIEVDTSASRMAHQTVPSPVCIGCTDLRPMQRMCLFSVPSNCPWRLPYESVEQGTNKELLQRLWLFLRPYSLDLSMPRRAPRLGHAGWILKKSFSCYCTSRPCLCPEAQSGHFSSKGNLAALS